MRKLSLVAVLMLVLALLTVGAATAQDTHYVGFVPPALTSPFHVAMVDGATARAEELGWTLEVQTNDLATGLTGVWTPVPNSDLIHSYTVPISQGDQTVFYRLVYTP